MAEITLERPPVPARLEAPATPMLFQVWFDLNFGEGPESDWWWDSEPEPLSDALDHAAEIRAKGWIALVLPEGQNPRPDGRWDNP